MVTRSLVKNKSEKVDEISPVCKCRSIVQGFGNIAWQNFHHFKDCFENPREGRRIPRTEHSTNEIYVVDLLVVPMKACIDKSQRFAVFKN